MDNSLTSDICKYCDKPVPETSMLTHIAHCERDIRKQGGFVTCDKCDLEIPKIKLQRHLDEQHAPVNCPECHERLERLFMKHHLENECQMRCVTCTFCNTTQIARDLEHHMVICGTNTEKCEECEETIMLKYKHIHLDSNHGFIKLDDEVPNICFGGIARSPQVSSVPQYIPREIQPRSGLAEDVSKVSLPCEFCDEIFPAYKLHGHQLGCRLKQQTRLKTANNPSISEVPSSSILPPINTSSYVHVPIITNPRLSPVYGGASSPRYSPVYGGASSPRLSPVYGGVSSPAFRLPLYDRRHVLRSFDYMSLNSSRDAEDEDGAGSLSATDNLIPCEYCSRMLRIGEVMSHQMHCFLQH